MKKPKPIKKAPVKGAFDPEKPKKPIKKGPKQAKRDHSYT